MNEPSFPLSARALAVRQLAQQAASGAFLSHLDGATDTPDPRRDRQATNYVAGVTRWRRWLDFLITQFYRGDADALEPLLRQILRLGLFELLLQATPPHAAIHEAVELTKALVRPQAAKLVNGLLRSVQRQREALPQPQTGKPFRDLAIRHSHPNWMVRRWLARFGPEETLALLQWNNAAPTYGLRLNTARQPVAAFHEQLTALGVDWEPSPYLEDFVRVRQLQPVLQAGMLDEGHAAVQDEAAGLVVRLLDPQPGETILDACAAPGGKSLYAAARLQNTGRVLAFDLHPHRIALLPPAAQAHGLDIIETGTHDLLTLADSPEAPSADRVLLDVPCSGLGVLAKRADLRWQREAASLNPLTSLQDAMLDAGARLVRPGGLLVYSTCTLAPEENEHRVTAFLARNPQFQTESAVRFVPESLVTPEGYYASLPHRHHMDGAFGVRLRHQA